MKRWNRIGAWMLIVALALTLCACGKEKTFSNQGTEVEGKTIWYLGGNNIMNSVDPAEVFAGYQDTVDPGAIYSSLELTEEMLHGAYMVNNKEKDLKQIRQDIPFEEVNFKNGPLNVTKLPVAVYFGAEYICSDKTGYKYNEYRQITDQEVAVLELATEDQTGWLPCTYEVTGNSVTFKQIEMTSQDPEPFAYGYTGVEFTYDIKLNGPELLFSRDGSSLTLRTYLLTENTDAELSVIGYSLPDSPLVDGLDYFACDEAYNYAVNRQGEYFDISAYMMDDQGRFTMYLANRDMLTGEVDGNIRQFACIIQSDASSFLPKIKLILLDGSKIYYYTDDIAMREARALEDQGINAGTLSQDELKQIGEKKADLLNDLADAFAANDIDATVNRSTGEIALDTTVLFGVDEAVIGQEGKAFLEKFMGVYASVVFGEKYENFVSKIMIEGHTDTTGTYEHNQELSQARADAVKEFLLSEECGVDPVYGQQLVDMLLTKGCAYDKPVYDENGQVDMDASRRVSFKFVINIED